MGDVENMVRDPEPIEETPPEKPPTIADELKKAGLTREEIAETMREVLAEAKPAPSVDLEAAEKEYFGSFMK